MQAELLRCNAARINLLFPVGVQGAIDGRWRQIVHNLELFRI